MSKVRHIRIASDLHLEAFKGRDLETLAIDFLSPDDRDQNSILVLAGDISSDREQLVRFLSVCAKRFHMVYFVFGNHELYRHDILSYPAEIREAVRSLSQPNIKIATDSVEYEELDDLKIRFIFGTLWADGGPNDWSRAEVSRYLNDFRLIRKGMTPLSTARIPFKLGDMVKIHKEHKAKIEELLKQPFDGRTVVITHHLPSRRLVSARYWPGDGTDGANGGFASDCDNLIAVHEPWLWIHGHTHDTIDTELWKTRIVCNPAGYRGEWSTPFNTFLVEPKFVELL